MSKNELQLATIEEFFYWINERHNIYVNRFIKKQEKPWTDDEILQRYKFTNVFRQLDTGTIALDKKILGKWFNSKIPLRDLEVEDAIDILFNVVWYRLFNLADHAEEFGFVHTKNHDIIRKILVQKQINQEKVFTSAHMTSGSGGDMELHGKIYAHMIAPVGIAEEFGEQLISFIYYNQTMQAVTKRLQDLPMIGPFIAYEIACDLRFTPLLSGASDILTWANLGPGARRGLMRLGMPVSNESMVKLYKMAENGVYLKAHVLSHFFNMFDDDTEGPPFELREIEHSLCEFDKYMRTKTGVGTPRQKYKGYAE